MTNAERLAPKLTGIIFALPTLIPAVIECKENIRLEHKNPNCQVVDPHTLTDSTAAAPFIPGVRVTKV